MPFNQVTTFFSCLIEDREPAVPVVVSVVVPAVPVVVSVVVPVSLGEHYQQVLEL